MLWQLPEMVSSLQKDIFFFEPEEIITKKEHKVGLIRSRKNRNFFWALFIMNFKVKIFQKFIDCFQKKVDQKTRALKDDLQSKDEEI